MSELFAAGETIPPVWSRIPQFFAYPLKIGVLAVLGGFAALRLLALLLPIPFVGFIIFLLTWMGLYKYAYEVLAHTAQGNLEPPETQYITETDFAAFKHVGLMFLMLFGTILVAAFTGSAFLALLAGLFFGLAWPAAIITLAMTGSLLSALNPATWISVMGRIGWPYLAAVIFLLMMQWSAGFVKWLFASATAGAGALVVIGAFFISGYFLVASFHLMGYLVYQFHEELGVDVDEAATGAAPMSEDERAVAQSREMIQDGRVEDAIGLLAERLKREGGTPEVHDQYRQLLRLQGRNDELLTHDREYVGMLLHGFGQSRKALLVTDECLRLDPSFRPPNPGDRAELVRLGNQFAMPEVVVGLGREFLRDHPDDERAPEVTMAVARALSDRMGDDTGALKLLRELERRHSEHPLRDEAKMLAQTLEKVLAAQKPAK